MEIVYDDIWTYGESFDPKPWIVVTTNQGWKRDPIDNGVTDVMGRGIAIDCVNRYPHIQKLYGQYCQQYWCRTGKGCPLFVRNDERPILLPTKELDTRYPQYSFKNKSTTSLIARSLRQLEFLLDVGVIHDKVFLPLLGAGNGGMNPIDSQNLISTFLSRFENVTLFIQQEIALQSIEKDNLTTQ